MARDVAGALKTVEEVVIQGRELSQFVSDFTWYLRNLMLVQSSEQMEEILDMSSENLAALKEEAGQIIDMIESYQKPCYEKYGLHFIHASDEWYLLAEMELPEEERYDGYLQLENGVGMLRLLKNEFEAALKERKRKDKMRGSQLKGEISLATGLLAYSTILPMAEQIMEAYPGVRIHVYPITNYFFGERITVSGLLTGQDLMQQLTGKNLGSTLLLPETVLRSGEDVFLDDIRLGELENALQVPVNIVKSSGYDFVETILSNCELKE